MEYILEGFKNALKMIFSLDREVIAITLISLKVSIGSIMLATLAALPFGFYVGLKDFKGKKIIITVLNTLMSLPTIIIALMIYSLISRSGPFGNFGILYTPMAMVIGQAVLAFPIVSSLSVSATQNIDKKIEKTALTLGANRWQTALIIFSEGRFAYMAGIMAGFGRVFSELGVSLILGGSIKGYTRNITTAITLETSKGEIALGIALGIILLAVALLVNIFLACFQNYSEEKQLKSKWMN